MSDSLTSYRVWADDTVQEVDDGDPYSWLSDDFAVVNATDEEHAIYLANTPKEPRMKTLLSIEEWHRRARPARTYRDFNINLGVHLEEFAEMLAELEGDTHGTNELIEALIQDTLNLANVFKTGLGSATVPSENQANFLKELCDGIVTGVGVGYCAGVNVPAAADLVDRSNWSKYVQGVPQFDANGKVAKPESYTKPDLTGLY